MEAGRLAETPDLTARTAEYLGTYEDFTFSVEKPATNILNSSVKMSGLMGLRFANRPASSRQYS
jgi:hypothetical protein